MSDQDLAEVYQSIANGDEEIPTEPIPDPSTETGFASQLPTIPTSQFVLNRAKINPDEAAFQHPLENRPVTALEILKDLAKEKSPKRDQAPQPPSIQQVNSQEEYDALPSGSFYMDSHGQSMRKK